MKYLSTIFILLSFTCFAQLKEGVKYITPIVDTSLTSDALQLVNVNAFGAFGLSRSCTNVCTTNGVTLVYAVDGNFSAADKGKVITIWYAGQSNQVVNAEFTNWNGSWQYTTNTLSTFWNHTTTINGISNSTMINLASAPLTATNAVKCYIGDDETLQVQNAINTAAAAGKKYVFFPKGKYLIAGDIVDPLSGTGSHKGGQLYIPDCTQYHGTELPSITLVGVDSPGIKSYSHNERFDFNDTGTTLISTHTNLNCNAVIGCALTNGYAFFAFSTNGNDYPPGVEQHNVTFNPIHVTVKNMTIRTAGHPTGSALDLSGANGCIVEGVSIDSGSRLYSFPQPGSLNSYAIRLPVSLFGGKSIVRDVHVYGFNTGIDLGEWSEITASRIESCYNAFTAYRAGGHRTVIFAGVEDCKYYFSAWKQPYGIQANISAENPFQTDWSWPAYLIRDPLNVVHGYCSYEHTSTTTVKLPKIGGANFAALYCPYGNLPIWVDTPLKSEYVWITGNTPYNIQSYGGVMWMSNTTPYITLSNYVNVRVVTTNQ